MAKKPKDGSGEAPEAQVEAPAQKFRITLPVRSREFKSAGLVFRDGVAQTTDAQAAEICRGLGYTVETLD